MQLKTCKKTIDSISCSKDNQHRSKQFHDRFSYVNEIIESHSSFNRFDLTTVVIWRVMNFIAFFKLKFVNSNMQTSQVYSISQTDQLCSLYPLSPKHWRSDFNKFLTAYCFPSLLFGCPLHQTNLFEGIGLPFMSLNVLGKVSRIFCAKLNTICKS